jgi:hypothetical protein
MPIKEQKHPANKVLTGLKVKSNKKFNRTRKQYFVLQKEKCFTIK